MRASIGNLVSVLFIAACSLGASARDNWPTPPATVTAPPQISGPLQGGTADHTRFEELKGPFASGPEVTRACLGCHTETGTQWLTGIAMVHTAAAFAILTFVLIPVYMLTTGHSFRDHLMPMITGFDEVDLSEAEEAYLRQDQPADIR